MKCLAYLASQTMSAAEKDKAAQQAATSTTQEAAIIGPSPVLVDLNRTQESSLGSMFSGSQMPERKRPIGFFIPLEVPTVAPIPPSGASDPDIKGAIQLLTQLVAAQAQRQNVDIPVATQEGIAKSRIKDFLRMNPPEFTGSKLTEDPQYFIDETHRICKVMWVPNTDAVELDAHRLKDIIVDWYEIWVDLRGQEAPPAVWTEFAEVFMDHFMPLELREAKIDEFLSLKQGNLSVKEYYLQFTQLSKYAPEVVNT
ncbi:uncharacterized protein LOC124899265 [Capsicum annuum]|uniref:uncharacterized protein LOC124899265 n=1 Tax=Capsicum annuum TaxID=4072 RepID=UPI001FB0B6C2|nr:uncharacterized protein LOC124899265 [Capsicum annuum]